MTGKGMAKDWEQIKDWEGGKTEEAELLQHPYNYHCPAHRLFSPKLKATSGSVPAFVVAHFMI